MGKKKEIFRKFLQDKWANSQAVPGPNHFIFVLDHLKASYNIGKIFRTAEIFGCREIHLVGIPFFDSYPSKGGFKRVPAFFFETFEQSVDRLSRLGYQIYLMDPKKGKALPEIKLNPKSAFVLGGEFLGLSMVPENLNLDYLKIPQSGQIESLNVSIAGAITAYEYLRQFPMTVEKSVSDLAMISEANDSF